MSETAKPTWSSAVPVSVAITALLRPDVQRMLESADVKVFWPTTLLTAPVGAPASAPRRSAQCTIRGMRVSHFASTTAVRAPPVSRF